MWLRKLEERGFVQSGSCMAYDHKNLGSSSHSSFNICVLEKSLNLSESHFLI